MDAWDILYQQSSPVLSSKVSDTPLTSIKVEDQGLLMAVGAEDGNVSMLELSQSLCEVNRQDKLATSEMFERETRREKILEAIELNREMQLRQKNKSGHFTGGKKETFCLTERKEAEEEKKKVDPLEEAEKEFYRIINEVKLFHLQNATRIFAFHLGRCCCHSLILLTNNQSFNLFQAKQNSRYKEAHINPYDF